jgi:nucleotide-binding universal stress UspA family protein
MFKNIIVAHDGTACSDVALEYAFSLAKTFESNLTVCHATDFSSAALVMAGPIVNDPGPLYAALHDDARSVDQHVRLMAAKAGVSINLCEVENTAANGILQTAKDKHADLIIVGSHGKHGFAKLFDPSVSAQVAGTAHVPLLVVPHDSPQCEAHS